MNTALIIEILFGTVIIVVLIANGGILMQMVQHQKRLLERLEELESPQDNTGAAHLPEGLEIGEPAPNFTLPDLTGRMVEMADFRGGRTLVLFWNPACSFCGQMVDDLKAWDANPPPEAPNLLVVSTGTVEANLSMGLHSMVVLDEDFRTVNAFKAMGTPTSVLIDADGKIASKLAIGPMEVLKLADSNEVTAHHS